MKALFKFFIPALAFRLSFGGDSGGTNSSSSTQNTSTALDNRLVLGDGSLGATGGSSIAITDTRDQSVNVNDSRNLSTMMDLTVNDSSNRSSSSSSDSSVKYTDNSNRSVNQFDPGALRAMETAITANTKTTDRAFSFGSEAFGFAATANKDALGFARSSASELADAQRESQDKAFAFAEKSNATVGAGFSQLLSLGKSMFDSNIKAVENVGALTTEAYRSATTEKSGSLDNKTITILGLAAAAAFALMAWKK
ncbi:hypothetical protein [Roseateles microcysteis]|uniref:hypothetical protein n=1 Tax=Roseateles microcysteis TaxID=3119057 RepID=UPI002FE57743